MIDHQLKGKVALVTGVSRKHGIGAAICKKLAEAGVQIFTSYFRPYDRTMLWKSEDSEAEEIIKNINAQGVKADGIEIDLTDSKAPGLLLDAAEKVFRKVDILINNATVGRDANVFNMTADQLDEAYALIVRGTLLLCSEFANRHDGKSDGRIIILTSGQGEKPMPEEIPYIVSKAGLDAFTRSASISLAKKKITINAVDPGATDSGWMSNESYKHIKDTNPMGRVGMPEDAARLVVFLASSEAQWITGQVIRSTGGSF